MKKLMTKIIGLGLGLTLATSVGVVAFVAYNNTSSEQAQATSLHVTFTADSNWTASSDPRVSYLTASINDVTARISGGQIDSGTMQITQGKTITISVPENEYYISKVIYKSVSGTYSIGNSINQKQKSFVTSDNGTVGTYAPSTLASNNSFNMVNSDCHLLSIDVTYVPASTRTLTSLSIEGVFEDEYYLGEEWDVSNLTVKAYYDGLSESIDVTSDVEWSFNPAYVNSYDIEEVKITVRYAEGAIAITKTQTESDLRIIDDEVTGFAKRFNKTLSTGANAICDANGNTDLNALTSAWSDLSTAFNNLSATSQNRFKGSTSGGDIAKAVALYDYILNKYGTSSLSDFMGRDPVRSNIMGKEVKLVNYDASLALLVILSLAVTTVGAYIFLRKKKHN